jgi:hypothetical protein
MSSINGQGGHRASGQFTKEELDVSWKVYCSPSVASSVQCIDARIVNTNHSEKRHPSILLEFYSDGDEKYIMYFNVVTNKQGYAVKHDSKFACLYRLALGTNPIKRFSKVHQLMKHLIGVEFCIEDSQNKYDDGVPYQKVKVCSPVTPMYSEEWNKAGRLIPKRKEHRGGNTSDKLEIIRKPIGDELETGRKLIGNELETLNGCKAHKHLVSEANLPRNNVQRNKEQRNNVQSDDVYKPIAINQGNTVTNHKRREGESNDEYYDRIIDETFKSAC